MDMTSIMDMFGFEAPKKPEKKAKKEVEKKQTPAKKVAVDAYELPISVFTGFYGCIEMTGEKKVVTMNDIRKMVSEKTGLPLEILVGETDGKGKAFVGVSKKKADFKSELEITNDTVFQCRGTAVDVSSIMTEEKCKVSVSDISGVAAEVFPGLAGCGVVKSAENTYELVFSDQGFEKDIVKFPFRMGCLGKEIIEVTEENLKAFLNAKEIEVGDKIEMDNSILVTYANALFPDFGGKAKLSYHKDKNFAAVVMDLKEAPVVRAATPKKEELIPTEDVKIGMTFKQIEISPDDFGGRTEVKKADIVKFLTKIYPEFGTGVVTIDYYKKEKLIIPTRTGSRKGALNELVQDEKECARLLSEDYSLFRIKVMDREFQVENTPVSKTVACCDGTDPDGIYGTFEWKIAKIPFSIILGITKFFKDVEECMETEVMVRIWYDPENQEFHVTLPRQQVTGSSICETEDEAPGRGFYEVMEMHSHCRFMAFFSETDNAYEKGNKLFGVIGDLYKPIPSMKLRAGTRGYYTSVDWSEITEAQDKSKDILNRYYVEKAISDQIAMELLWKAKERVTSI